MMSILVSTEIKTFLIDKNPAKRDVHREKVAIIASKIYVVQ